MQARPTRRELQTELESLRRLTKASAKAGQATVPAAATSISPRHSGHDKLPGSETHQSPGSASHSTIERGTLPMFPGEISTSEAITETPANTGTELVDSCLTASRNLNDLEVSSEAIDACFEMFV